MRFPTKRLTIRSPVRDIAQSEQRLRLRSRPLSFRVHRRPAGRPEGQRLPYCCANLRGYERPHKLLERTLNPLTPYAGIKSKVENKEQYKQYLDELEPLRKELGVPLKEDLYPEAKEEH